DAEDGLLGNGRVPHPLLAELSQQPGGGLEHAGRRAAVLAQADARGVTAQLPCDPFRHRLPVGDDVLRRRRQVRHAEPPCAQTSVRASKGSGPGAALAAVTASSTMRAALAPAAATDSSRTPDALSRARARSSRSRLSPCW